MLMDVVPLGEEKTKMEKDTNWKHFVDWSEAAGEESGRRWSS